MTNTALIVGSSGILGSATAELLQQSGFEVLGLARRPGAMPGVGPIAADLLDGDALQAALADTRPTHVYLTTWSRQATEAENIEVNARMVRNVLEAVRPAGSLCHVALVTGLKHYLGPFEAYGKGTLPETPFREEQGRLDVENFYYAQEDEVFAAAKSDGFTWSVHRPHTVIGKAVGNAMNMGTTLAVHASICRETGRPFRFPGSTTQWSCLTDMSDARQVARQLLWASTTPAAANEDFNIVNGDIFRWKWMWAEIAGWFGVEPVAPGPEPMPLEGQMANADSVWQGIVEKHGLAEADLGRLASPWHTDADLGRPLEVVADMSKSRRLGFTAYQDTRQSFFDLFTTLRAERLIP